MSPVVPAHPMMPESLSPQATPHEVPVDRCPGLVRPYRSNDGMLVRLRTGGRPISVSTLAELISLAEEFGDGTVQLTSRGAVQLRGVVNPLPAALVDRIGATGIIPSPSHELVRNIVVSPLSGIDGAGHADVRDVAAAYDEALQADPDLAALPGRFLVVVDDGRGDVLGEQFDLAYQAHGPDHGVVYAGDIRHGWAVQADHAAPAMIALARAFLVARAAIDPAPWHVRELPLPLPAPLPGATETNRHVVTRRPSLGAVVSAEGAVATMVGVPLGLLTRGMFMAVAQVAVEAHCGDVIVTPWRSLVIPKVSGRLLDLEQAGLVTDEMSAWARVAACTGAPGCARADLDTRAFARELVSKIDGDGRTVYISACERRCGAPSGDYVDLVRPVSVDAAIAVTRTPR
ncbi:hypothetical protein KEM60_02177 [Austwickia sp. TVS 96-490-7B]|uniref:precorrin-3B synthase n=1 Tax=Austwickia sp. TVS 96-490-7B TaxID=2830843 RepID=UPI001C580756|nr:precorrin-3B synthase [Austwickia sp. TVS 96-490-7B]MBW3085966.1 hypothetical protein [Austwickia sp. TVS 96-490-7B]